MTAPTIPIRATMPDGTTHIEHVVGMSVACAHRPQAVALEVVDGGPDWRRVGPGLLAALGIIATQKTTPEMQDDDVGNAEWQFAYDMIVLLARAALEAKP